MRRRRHPAGFARPVATLKRPRQLRHGQGGSLSSQSTVIKIYAIAIVVGLPGIGEGTLVIEFLSRNASPDVWNQIDPEQRKKNTKPFESSSKFRVQLTHHTTKEALWCLLPGLVTPGRILLVVSSKIYHKHQLKRPPSTREVEQEQKNTTHTNGRTADK